MISSRNSQSRLPWLGELLKHHLAHNETKSTINFLESMDKNTAIVVSALIAFLGLLPSAAMSHSGGTNSSGCHENSKTGDYHCHTPKSGTPSTSSRSSGFSSSTLRTVPTFSNKSASGLSSEDYELNEDCKKFSFSEILSQADRGYVRVQCGQIIMSIISH